MAGVCEVKSVDHLAKQSRNRMLAFRPQLVVQSFLEILPSFADRACFAFRSVLFAGRTDVRTFVVFGRDLG
jgi:hypothetical protein